MRPFLLLLAACTGVGDPEPPVEQEFITTVEITIGGVPFRWSDPENDGSPEVDSIVLPGGSGLSTTVRFFDELSQPNEELTEEIEDEAEEHQLFFAGSAPVTYEYQDEDLNGLPVGLLGVVQTESPGSGTLRLMLRHLPPQDGTVVKVAGLEDLEWSSLPGEADVDVEFPLEVQ